MKLLPASPSDVIERVVGAGIGASLVRGEAQPEVVPNPFGPAVGRRFLKPGAEASSVAKEARKPEPGRLKVEC
jgi:hypothetical protein